MSITLSIGYYVNHSERARTRKLLVFVSSALWKGERNTATFFLN